ncbi:hypothetical protein F2Q68_00031032 [Brassica cretica]|uniref:Chromo domain-containing protein n=1 Tax=Brassica cretica TaxID=69181 RepID=A0A8S9G9Q8_BRACR|nr:hypothetical protein F2Q68_00031032 [Brassica cretica]
MQLDTQKHEVLQYVRSAHANRHAEARVSRCMNTRHAEGVYLVLVLLCENLVVVLVVVCRSLLPQMPPASPIEDRGTAIPIEDRDQAIPERLRLCGERRIRRLKNREIPQVQVFWGKRNRVVVTWEDESRFKALHPEFFHEDVVMEEGGSPDP